MLAGENANFCHLAKSPIGDTGRLMAALEVCHGEFASLPGSRDDAVRDGDWRCGWQGDV
jgi:hypothetical protein